MIFELALTLILHLSFFKLINIMYILLFNGYIFLINHYISYDVSEEVNDVPPWRH